MRTARVWIKSCVGLNVSEAPRDISFCGHAILGDDLFIIFNAIEDERFADNPAVLGEPYVRFYAGCLLRAPNGCKLGTLCIIDHQPRSFGKEDIEALKDLGLMVEHELAAIQQATFDELTHISNRRGFMILAQYGLHLCARQKITASLAFIDLDKFKPINDTFGHAEGDRALTVFAEHMKAICRKSDIISRLGGDEFAMLLINTSKEHADNVVVKLCQSVEKYNQEAKRGYDIIFSHGIVEFNPEKHFTIEAMLADGDALMYALKKLKG